MNNTDLNRPACQDRVARPVANTRYVRRRVTRDLSGFRTLQKGGGDATDVAVTGAALDELRGGSPTDLPGRGAERRRRRFWGYRSERSDAGAIAAKQGAPRAFSTDGWTRSRRAGRRWTRWHVCRSCPTPAISTPSPRDEAPRPLFSRRHAPRRTQPTDGVMRFDVARPADLMDNAAALPTTPQAPQPQQKRSKGFLLTRVSGGWPGRWR